MIMPGALCPMTREDGNMRHLVIFPGWPWLKHCTGARTCYTARGEAWCTCRAYRLHWQEEPL